MFAGEFPSRASYGITTSTGANPSDQQPPQRRRSIRCPAQYLPRHIWRGKHQPSAPLDEDEPCPIKWMGKLGKVNHECRAAYEARAPWRSGFNMSNSQFGDMLNIRFGLKHTAETWRRRFCAANEAVYRATGLWWEDHPIGLQQWIGKPPASRSSGRPLKRVRQRFEGDTFLFKIREPGSSPENTIDQPVPEGPLARASPNINRWVAEGRAFLLLQAPENIVNAYTSMYAPYPRTKLPAGCIYHLGEDEDGSLFWLEVPFHWSLEDLFGIYSIASSLEDDDVRDIIIDQWHTIFLDGRKLREDYLNGVRSWDDTPTGTVHSILDFEPEHLNLLWETTDDHDPARKFWLDIIDVMGDTAFNQIDRFLSEYIKEFRLDWMQRLNPEQRERISVIDPSVEPKHMFELFDDSEILECSISQDANKSVEPVRAMTHQEINEDLRRMKLDLESAKSIPKANWAPNVAKEVEMRNKLLTDILKDITPREDSVTEFMNASIETPTMITRPSITINLTSAKPVFCQHYHNHYLSGTLSCYPRRIRGNHSDDPALRRDDSGNHPPPHHVILTVNGVHGFKIQNHTGLSECEFLDLPHIYPEWRWESIRSVNNFTPRSGFGTDFLVDVLTDPNPYGNYQPVYFESEYQPQDDQGRWPSHPGYGQGPSWSQDWN